MAGTLFVVATPIGNLNDVSERAKVTLSSVDAILAEDTRVTSKLLAKLEIKKTLITYHQHSDKKRESEILHRLANGETLALVSDAGTPGISDPGGKLIEEIVREFGDDVVITPIPGPNAAATALSVAGFPADEFLFLGFPPHKKGRNTFFDRIANTTSTIVFFESTHRIQKALETMNERMSDRRLLVARELTKLHETLYRGNAKEILEKLNATSTKGEFVVVVAPK